MRMVPELKGREAKGIIRIGERYYGLVEFTSDRQWEGPWLDYPKVIPGFWTMGAVVLARPARVLRLAEWSEPQVETECSISVRAANGDRYALRFNAMAGPTDLLDEGEGRWKARVHLYPTGEVCLAAPGMATVEDECED